MTSPMTGMRSWDKNLVASLISHSKSRTLSNMLHSSEVRSGGVGLQVPEAMASVAETAGQNTNIRLSILKAELQRVLLSMTIAWSSCIAAPVVAQVQHNDSLLIFTH